MRGCVVYAVGPSTDVVTMNAGSSWHFDSSLAPSPAATHYAFQQAGESSTRAFVTNGTSQSRVVVDSNIGGGNGLFSMGGFTYGGLFRLAYTDFTRIGTATVAGWEWRAGTYIAQNNRYTNCGQIGISSGNLTLLSPGGTMQHNYNVHIGTLSNKVLYVSAIFGPADTGVHELVGNVFDVTVTDDTTALGSFTIRNNYLGGGLDVGAGSWALFSFNVIRQPNKSGNGFMHPGGDILNSYVLLDSDVSNPKPFQQLPYMASNLDGVIVGQAGNSVGGPNSVDSGELWFSVNPSSQMTSTVKNSIILPNMNGYSTMEIGAWGVYLNLIGVIEHNTWFGGFSSDGWLRGVGYPALQMAEGVQPISGQIASFRSNILWNPQLTGYTAHFAKMGDVTGGYNNPLPVTNICLPSSCDYNTGFGHTATNPAATRYRNQAKGYLAKFTSAPGVHDVDADPQFVDYKRSLELLSSKYLGLNPAAWSNGASYAIGNQVQWQRSDIYWNTPVNFRYVNAGACAGSNPEPGAGVNWRDCWEWDSLYQIRQSVAAKTLYDDQTIGAHNVDLIETLLQWVRAGYSPTNSLLAGAAHDGSDIGAVPVSFPPR